MPALSDPLETGVHRQIGDNDDDLLVGTEADDFLLGLGGNDTLVGNRGTDYLEGGDGNDCLSVGYRDPKSGNDPYPNNIAFDKSDGHDTLTDFTEVCIVCQYPAGSPIPGDRIVLLGGTQEDIAAVMASATGTENAVLRYGDTEITVMGYRASDVQEYWFALG